MIKTVYWLRFTEDGPHIDTIMSAEWPEHLTNDTINTVAQIRGEPPAKIMNEVLSDEVKELLQAYPMMEMRARLNSLKGPYVVNSEEKMSDEVLITHALVQGKPNSTKRK